MQAFTLFQSCELRRLAEFFTLLRFRWCNWALRFRQEFRLYLVNPSFNEPATLLIRLSLSRVSRVTLLRATI